LKDKQDKSNINKEKKEDVTKAERVVKFNAKDNVPIQTEEGEAETYENAQVEHLADEDEIERRRED